MSFVIRKAKIKDVPIIVDIVNFYARQRLMLPLSLNKVYDYLRDFSVVEEDEEIVGCGALHIYWEDLAEIRSLAVREDKKGKGYGKKIVEFLLNEAKELEIKRVFALTYQVNFFKKLGFKEIDKKSLPQKIWRDCLDCPLFPNCDEVAVIKEVE